MQLDDINSENTVCMYLNSKRYKHLVTPSFTLMVLLFFMWIKKSILVSLLTLLVNMMMIFSSELDPCIVEVICLLIISKSAKKATKVQLFKSYRSSFYCGHIWYHFTQASMSNVRVAYKQIYTRFFNLSKFESISYDMICNNVDSFNAIIRKSIHSFRKRILFLRTMLSFSPFIIPHTSLSLAYVKCGIISYIALRNNTSSIS